MVQNEMKAKAGLPERVRLNEGLGLLGVVAKHDIGFAPVANETELPADLDMLLLKERLCTLIEAICTELLCRLELHSLAFAEVGEHPRGDLFDLVALRFG